MKIILSDWVNNMRKDIINEAVWNFIDAVYDIAENTVSIKELEILAKLLVGKRVK